MPSNFDHDSLKEVAEFDQHLNSRSDVYQCACGFSFIAISPPNYCPGCGTEEFKS